MAHSVAVSEWLLLALCIGLTVCTAILPTPTLDQFIHTPVPVESRADDSTSIAYRLPNTTRPLAYDVHVTTNVHLSQFAFTGIVLIRLEVVEATRSIVLHQRSLNITAARLWNVQTNLTIGLANERPYDATTEMLTMSVAAGGAPLTVGAQYALELSYAGELRGSEERGFYRSSYTDAQNNTKCVYEIVFHRLSVIGDSTFERYFEFTDGWPSPSSSPPTPGTVSPATMSPLCVPLSPLG